MFKLYYIIARFPYLMVSILLLIDLLKLRGRLGKAQMETIRLSTLTNLRHPNR